jgi:hypothetical protein
MYAQYKNLIIFGNHKAYRKSSLNKKYVLHSSLQLFFKTEILVGPHVKCPLLFINLTKIGMFYAYR